VGIAVGYFLGATLMARRARRTGFNEDHAWNAAVVGVLGAIVGARTAYVIGHSDQFENPIEYLQIYRGGISLMGGLIGGFFAAWLYARSKKLDFGRLADLGAPGLAIGTAIGRIGDLVIGDHLGRTTDGFWGWRYEGGELISPPPCDTAVYPSPTGCIQPGMVVHQTALYDAIWALVIFFILMRLDRKPRPRGFLVWTWAALYAIGRIVTDFTRVDKTWFGTGLTGSQLTAIAVLLLAVIVLGKLRRAPVPAAAATAPGGGAAGEPVAASTAAAAGGAAASAATVEPAPVPEASGAAVEGSSETEATKDDAAAGSDTDVLSEPPPAGQDSAGAAASSPVEEPAAVVDTAPAEGPAPIPEAAPVNGAAAVTDAQAEEDAARTAGAEAEAPLSLAAQEPVGHAAAPVDLEEPPAAQGAPAAAEDGAAMQEPPAVDEAAGTAESRPGVQEPPVADEVAGVAGTPADIQDAPVPDEAAGTAEAPAATEPASTMDSADPTGHAPRQDEAAGVADAPASVQEAPVAATAADAPASVQEAPVAAGAPGISEVPAAAEVAKPLAADPAVEGELVAEGQASSPEQPESVPQLEPLVEGRIPEGAEATSRAAAASPASDADIAGQTREQQPELSQPASRAGVEADPVAQEAPEQQQTEPNAEAAPPGREAAGSDGGRPVTPERAQEP
ncbi:MAG TPA: prolipoprotein diacylglyceryl transferase family protein, partial [Actinomycetota bacterium]|nr:prolipoprotein diacylglyceryl transferase family protein [Actinomycetota bacterium]